MQPNICVVVGTAEEGRERLGQKNYGRNNDQKFLNLLNINPQIQVAQQI